MFIKDILFLTKWNKHSKIVKIIAAFSIFLTFSLYIISTPLFSYYLASNIEDEFYFEKVPLSKDIDAVAILGAGEYQNKKTQEYLLNFGTYLRVLEGVRFFKYSDAKWIVMSGGNSSYGNNQMTTLMKEMAITLGVPKDKIILESNSKNTYEHPIRLIELDVFNSHSNIAVATSAWHLPRAMDEFNKYFINVIAVPTDFYGKHKLTGAKVWFPQVNSLSMSINLYHELIGGCWYRLRTLIYK